MLMELKRIRMLITAAMPMFECEGRRISSDIMVFFSFFFWDVRSTEVGGEAGGERAHHNETTPFNFHVEYYGDSKRSLSNPDTLFCG